MINRFLSVAVFVALAHGAYSQDEDADQMSLSDTVFTGDYLEMVSGDDISEFHMLGNVTVVGTNLHLTSNELHITAEKVGDKDATVTELGEITKILAIGAVKLKQQGRTAEAGRAEFYPKEKKVLLTENPVVTDEQGTVSGEEIEWFHGQRKAQVRGGQQRVVVKLGAMPDLGPDPNAEPEQESEGGADAEQNTVEEDNTPEEDSDNNQQ